MYSPELQQRLIKLLAPDGYLRHEKSEARYPRRSLVEGAIVTRSAPSPTGFVHIGTIYMSLINKLVALRTSGVNILRIEDTDKKREIVEGIEIIVNGLAQFDLRAEEGVDESGHSYGLYGPYIQSERSEMYLGFAIKLLQTGRAYPCFATAKELNVSYTQQQIEKVRPGYYGKWALWRNKTETEISAALDDNMPFVLRFKSEGTHEKRVQLIDLLKGALELPENDMDVPLIKSDDYHLPTYHLAHVVDDYLMQTTVILRGDEWLPSTPLHIELAQALGIKPFQYAHFTPINIMDGSSKRKLSKRKDPQADINYFIAAGYPTTAILEYLLRLADSSFEVWRENNQSKTLWEFPFSFEKWSKARGALLDIQKLDDVSKQWIAQLPQAEYVESIAVWAKTYAPYFLEAINLDKPYSKAVFAIERDSESARKDLSKWSDAPEQYGYFFDGLFAEHFAKRIAEELEDLSQETITDATQSFSRSFNVSDDQAVWFDKFKDAAEFAGFAIDNKKYKESPEMFKGNLADFARILRVKISGKNRTPDLFTIMRIMGQQRVLARLKQ